MKYLTLTSLNAFDPLPSLGEKIARPSFSPRKHAVKEVKPNLWLHPDGKMSYEPPEPEKRVYTAKQIQHATNYGAEIPNFFRGVQAPEIPHQFKIGDVVLPKTPPGFDLESRDTLRGQSGFVVGKLPNSSIICVKFIGWTGGHRGEGCSESADCWWYEPTNLTLIHSA